MLKPCKEILDANTNKAESKYINRITRTSQSTSSAHAELPMWELTPLCQWQLRPFLDPLRSPS